MFYNNLDNGWLINLLTRSRPVAIAEIKGAEGYPLLNGRVKFYTTPLGTMVVSEISGLPMTESGIFAEHIHLVGQCEGNFSSAGGHFNPEDKPHPLHAGDLPPLFSANGKAIGAVLTDRFVVGDIVGKSVIIHLSPDDFTTQPSGNSGARIACGIIKRV